MSQTLWDFPPSNFCSIYWHHSYLTLVCSSVSLWGTQRAQRFLTKSSWRRILSKLPDEIFNTSFISFSVIFGFSMIRLFTLATVFSLLDGRNGHHRLTTFHRNQILWSIDGLSLSMEPCPRNNSTTIDGFVNNLFLEDNHSKSWHENPSLTVKFPLSENHHLCHPFCSLAAVWVDIEL